MSEDFCCPVDIVSIGVIVVTGAVIRLYGYAISAIGYMELLCDIERAIPKFHTSMSCLGVLSFAIDTPSFRASIIKVWIGDVSVSEVYPL